jgi:hypothetical protein
VRQAKGKEKSHHSPFKKRTTQRQHSNFSFSLVLLEIFLVFGFFMDGLRAAIPISYSPLSP